MLQMIRVILSEILTTGSESDRTRGGKTREIELGEREMREKV